MVHFLPTMITRQKTTKKQEKTKKIAPTTHHKYQNLH